LPISNKQALSERERLIRQRLKNDLEHYAARCLKIRTKAGKIEPLLFNRMQKHLHAQIEEHARKNAGRVRVLILKARQQGCSTYVGARFYHKATMPEGNRSSFSPMSKTRRIIYSTWPFGFTSTVQSW
jgi:hypothetical protein